MNQRTQQWVEYVFAVYGPALARRIFSDLVWRIDCDSQPVLFLTFDDGPTPHLTPKLLRILETSRAKATFFLLGKHIELDRDAVRRIEDRGHTVGLHGFDHLDAWKRPPSEVLDDLERGLELLSTLASRPVRHFRPPYGHFRRETKRWARENGLSIVMWDVMPGDYMVASTEDQIVARVRGRVKSGSVVVLHDSWNPNVIRNTAGALAKMVPLLQTDGWRFESL